MTLSFWRAAHLSLALFTFLFLLIASATGIILAYDAAQEKMQPYRAENFKNLNLAETIFTFKNNYSEITEISVDHNDFVTVEGTDKNGDQVKVYADPGNGKNLGKPAEKSKFINWITALHRSLFLKETGRFAIGVISALLVLISISGIILFLKRQKGFRHFFDRIRKDHFSQYFHVVSGRIFLIPIFIIALSGTFLFMKRFELIPKVENLKTEFKKNENAQKKAVKDFPVFRDIKLSEVKKVEFPFIEDDEEEFFTVKLKDREITVNQITGEAVSEEKYPVQNLLENLSLTLHTGRGSVFWSVILGISSASILSFIYSGFVITFRRSKNKIKNKFKADQAEIIILFGSENGSTLGFASKIHSQLLSDGKKSLLTELNNYRDFPAAKQLIIFTSTYGLGDAPANAEKFEKLLIKFPQNRKVNYSVVGFGSTSYDDFCGFAYKKEALLSVQKNFEKLIPLHTVNDRSTSEFAEWAKSWSYKTMIPLATAPSVYSPKIPKLKKFVVTDKTFVSDENSTFKINLKSKFPAKFKSGDLLAIYPENSDKERFYSIGKIKNSIQLIVKLHENGAGSGFLNSLNEKDLCCARIIKHRNFHFPEKSPIIAMIANGTGIAPFLGMIDENSKKKKIHLYCGFRKQNEMTEFYRYFAEEHLKTNTLTNFSFAYSREKDYNYVMDLVQRDAVFFVSLLKNGGSVMICGALKMQHDVENTLRGICSLNDLDYDKYRSAGQILTDCY